MDGNRKARFDLPLSPESLVPRLGDYLVETGKLEKEHLSQALKYQMEKAAQGTPIRLGQALRELGFIDAETLEQAVTVQIMQLQTALKQANQQLEQRVQERTYELRKALDRLTELTQVKANFIANISHELRTPLTLIKGYLDFMSDGGVGTITPEQGEAIGAMARAEGRLEKLIEDLIEYSGAERGQLKLEMSSVQLGELVRSTIQNSMQKVQTAQVNLSITLAQDLPAVRCDPGKISLVITELFNNAIKFTPKGGRVIVEAYPEKDVVTLAITDTGIGIPEEGLQEIFEPFHQLDGSSTRRYGGTGLGLALSNRIIETHGSRIRVQSAPGKGSRFEFSLPIDQRAWGQE